MNIFVGTWNLKSHGYYEDNNYFKSSIYQKGRIIYTNEMSMTVLIVLSEEPKGTKEIITYTGRYSFDDNHIKHHIEISLFPSRNNTIEIRSYKLVDKNLVLSVNHKNGRKYEIVWEKV